MKVRLEITDEDGTTHVNVEFTGDEWQKCLVSFIESFTGKRIQASGPSSASVSNYSSCQQAVPQSSPQLVPQFYQSPPPVFQMPVMASPPGMQPAAPPFFSPSQPLVYPYAIYPQYQQMVSPMHSNYLHSNVAQYATPAQPYDPSSVNQYTPVANTSQQSPQQSQSRQEQPVTSVRKVPSFKERIGDTKLTINERLELFLKYEYPRVWFSSQDIQQHYEKIYGPIKLSTVSTYLSRMFGKEILERRGNRTQREYRYISDEPAELQVYQGIPHQNIVQ